jgi:hypothetical protein
MADPDYFEIAKTLTQAHSLAAGRLYLPDTHLGHARAVVAALVDQICHMAQVTHQAYHGENNPNRWPECPKAFCQDAARLLASFSVGHGLQTAIDRFRRERNEARETLGEICELTQGALLESLVDGSLSDLHDHTPHEGADDET